MTATVDVRAELGGDSAAEPEVFAVLDAMTPAGSTEGALVIVGGGPGASCTGVLRRAVTEAQRPALWVHAMPGGEDGTQGCMGQWVASSQEQARPESNGMNAISGSTMGEFLGSLDEYLNSSTVIVVDNFHLLTPASANALLVWSQVARMQGVALLLGHHSSLDVSGVGALLTMATDVRWIDLHGLTREQVRTSLIDHYEWGSDELAHAAEAAVAGSPAMLRCLRRAIGSKGEVTAPLWRAAHRQALEGFGLFILSQQDRDVQMIARVAAWVYPKVSVADVAQNLGLDAHVAVRVERLLHELALISCHPLVMDGVRQALHEHSPKSLRQRCARAAQGMIMKGQGGEDQEFELIAEAIEDLTGTRSVAAAAYNRALSAGQHQRAVDITSRLIEGSHDAGEVAWARAARLKVWLRHDWKLAANEIAHGSLILAASVDEWRGGWGETAPLFGFEAPAAARALLAAERPSAARPSHDFERQLWACSDFPAASHSLRTMEKSDTAYVTCVALSALAGKAASARLHEIDAALSASGGWMDTEADSANRLALGWLAVADYERAARWAAVATFNAAPHDRAERGLGHLLRAQALLRSAEIDQAIEQSRVAAAEFDSFGATNLRSAAYLTLAHAQLEGRREPALMPEVPGPDAHPLIVAYHHYVQARNGLLTGCHQDAVRQLFDTGRAMQKVCPGNPSLLNWRLHLAAIFRATGQAEFVEQIEQDLVRAWRRWNHVEPEAVSRRGAVLGHLLGQVVERDSEVVGLEVLSPAERRVVEVVAEGKSNREVAKELFLSKRTVDTHLGNVYRKLGIDCRDGLAALVSADAACSTSALVACG